MFSKKNIFGLLSLFCVVLLASTLAFAQTTGSIQGLVVDPNGAVVAGATVKVTNTQTGTVKETTTNSDGFYRVTNLIPGDAYEIEVASSGFEGKKVQSVAVRLGQENGYDVQLGVKGAVEQVTVTSEAPLINATQNQLTTSYSPQQLTQLPYNGGSIDNLALLTPGVVTPGDTDFTNGVGISANGNRGRSNNFQIDGQDNNDNSVAGPTLTLTNSEAIGDYQVTTNNPSAEFGRNSGAQVNVITKNGTNDFRGSLFEYYQNSSLDTFSNIEDQFGKIYNFLATNGFPGLSGLAARNGKNLYSYHRFGGSLGGPIIKNKAFFFFTYQGDIQTGEQDTTNAGSGNVFFTPQSVAAARALGFVGANSILGNTQVGGFPSSANVPGQYIPIPQMTDTDGDGLPDAYVNGSPTFTNSLVVCNIFPGLGQPCPAVNRVILQTGEAIRIAPNRYRQHQIITREDFNATDKDIFSIRYIYDTTKFPDSPATGGFLTGSFFDVPSKNHNLGITYTRTLSAKFTNEFRFNFSKLDVRFGDPTGPLPGPGITFTGTRDLTGTTLSGAWGTANNLPQSRIVDVYQQQDTLSATLGNHSIRTGFDFRQQKVENFFLPNFLGVYRFRNQGALPAGTGTGNTFYTLTGAQRSGTANAFENLLLQRPERLTFALGNPQVNTSQNDYFFYFQDDWRILKNLTLNLGARYEYSSSPFNPIIDDLAAREASASTALFPTSFPLSDRTVPRMKADSDNFAPRVGFAWSPDLNFLGDRFTNGRTVIRGGFGISYDPSFFNIVLNTVTAAPFAVAGQILGVGTVPYCNPISACPGFSAATTPNTGGGNPRLFNQTKVDPNFYNPYTLNWNFGVQQEIFKDTVIEARYVGTRIIGQFQTTNANPSIRMFNNAASCLGLSPGAFTGGQVVGATGGNATDCIGGGFNNTANAVTNGRVDPTQGPVRLRTNGASGNYHGLQTRFDTRFNDILVSANYTWSKTIDNASEIFSTFAGGQTVAISENPFNTTSQERGLSAFDQRHNFTTNFIYESPFYKDQKGLVGKLLGGYQISGIVRIASGRPYSPFEFFGNYDLAFDSGFLSGVGPLRPYVGNPDAPVGTIAYGWTAACQVFFGGPECNYPNPGDPNTPLAEPGEFIIYNTLNPGSTGVVVANAAAARSQARLVYNDFGLLTNFAAGTFSYNQANDTGNGWTEAFEAYRTPFGGPRNTFFGNMFKGVNLALFKSTKINERYKLEFRVEANNVLNSRNFGVPDALAEDASNGLVVSSFQNPGFNAGAVRSLRFGLRFLF